MTIEKEQVTLRLPAEVLEKLRQEAFEYGLSLNAYIIILIRKGHQD